MELDLSEADLATLETSTEGWIAGLQMAGLSLQGREEVSAYPVFRWRESLYPGFSFRGSIPAPIRRTPEFPLADFHSRAALWRPCVMRLPLQRNSQAILDTLERSNLFLIALDEQRKWYRYHHLFSDLLKSRLKQTLPDPGVLLSPASEFLVR